jgi:hypothetical protein
MLRVFLCYQQKPVRKNFAQRLKRKRDARRSKIVFLLALREKNICIPGRNVFMIFRIIV